ncbi:MAG: hypothetical protein RJA70_1975 [Pseudomonadota bacterium]
MGVLLFQAATATLLVEHYPAFLYPPFARDKGEKGNLDILVPEFEVEWTNGSRSQVRLDELFAGVPANLGLVLAKSVLLSYGKREGEVLRNMKPGLKTTLVVLRGKLHRGRSKLGSELDPELRIWLAKNLARTSGGKQPTKLDVRWWSRVYLPSDPPELVTEHLIDEMTCDLSNAT